MINESQTICIKIAKKLLWLLLVKNEIIFILVQNEIYVNVNIAVKNRKYTLNRKTILIMTSTKKAPKATFFKITPLVWSKTCQLPMVRSHPTVCTD